MPFIPSAALLQSAVVGSVWSHVTGVYYQPPGFDSAFHNAVHTLNQEWCVAFPISRDETITSLTVRVTGAVATSVLRLGLRLDNGGKPGTLLLDAGTVDTASTGNKSVSISQAVTPGLIWVSMTGQVAAPDMYQMLCDYGVLTAYRGQNPDFNYSAGYYATGVSGALPSPFTSAGQLDSVQVTKVLVGF